MKNFAALTKHHNLNWLPLPSLLPKSLCTEIAHVKPKKIDLQKCIATFALVPYQT